MATEEQRSTWLLVKGTGVANELVVCLCVLATTSRSLVTIERFGSLISRFAAELVATNVASPSAVTVDDCNAFCWTRTRLNAAPSIQTLHLRRSAIRSFDSSGKILAMQVTPSSFSQKGVRRTGPLTDYKMTLVRTAALGPRSGTVPSAMTLALVEAGAKTRRIPNVR